MDRKQFFDSIKQGVIAPCYVFEGTEEYTKRAALTALRGKLLPPGMEEMNETRMNDPDANTIIAAAETLPFMADRRLVVVNDSGMLSGKPRDYDEASNAALMCNYVTQLPPAACIVFYVHDKADGRKKLYTALKKTAQVVQFERLDDREMPKWIAQQLKRLGKKIEASTCQKLVFTAGSELMTLDSEIQKLASYAGDREEILPEDIDKICIRTTAYRVFDLTNTLLRGDTKQAFTLSQALIRDGEEPLMLLSLLHGECRRMQNVKLLRARGMQPDEMARVIGAPPFAVRQINGQVVKYTEEQLHAMVKCCMDTEYQVKSGRTAQDGALEKAMLQIVKIRTEGSR